MVMTGTALVQLIWSPPGPAPPGLPVVIGSPGRDLQEHRWVGAVASGEGDGGDQALQAGLLGG